MRARTHPSLGSILSSLLSNFLHLYSFYLSFFFSDPPFVDLGSFMLVQIIGLSGTKTKSRTTQKPKSKRHKFKAQNQMMCLYHNP